MSMVSFSEYVVYHKHYKTDDPRLGRQVHHDSRSLFYLVAPKPRKALVSVKHTSFIPTLDQGQVGSCTGNASTKCLSYTPFWTEGATVLSATDAAADETYAVGVYSAATKIDSVRGSYPPDDTGSDGLSVAKVLTTRGLISGYQHATSLDAVITALQAAPVITGVDWYQDMFQPDADGRLHITGKLAGGHEFVLDEVDMENQRIWMQNSWGDSWGVNGRAYFTFDDYSKLLVNNGDVTVFVPLASPPPIPNPPPANDADSVFAAAAHKWLNGFPFFYRSFQSSLKVWLAKKGL